MVVEKMEKTFSYRRLEVIKHCPAVPDVMKRWPALFSESQVTEQFRRITTVNLERTFLTAGFLHFKTSDHFQDEG
ncbi:hypothetical protein SRHO_G00161050 [Serrasalmus rhombeus]